MNSCTLTILLCLLGASRMTGQNYSISQTGTYSIEINNPTSISVNQDDATQIPIGFDFDFFGVTYTDCWVGGDGYLSFGNYPTPGCCGQLIPDNSTPNNLIAVAWMNVDWISAHYEVFGNAPNRRLVITYDLRNPCDSSYYGQVKLFESTNVIEIHTQEWDGGVCQGWTVTQGIENDAGSLAYPVPGRNYNDTWQVLPGDDDFVSFTPSNYGYFMEEADQDFNLELSVPNDVTVYEDSFAVVPLDFPFEFFGYTYSNLYIAFNGFVSFEAPTGGGCCEGQHLPDPNNPNNLIAAAWTDVGPINSNGYNTYSYGTFGVAPNRRIVINFTYDDDCFSNYFHGQIHLLESDFSIELHTEYWAQNVPPCINTTQGIESPGGLYAYHLPDRNANTTWNVPCCGDMVRFTPLSSLPQNDAGVSQINTGPYCEGPELMSVFISNYGGQPIDSVQVNWTWNGVLQDSVIYHSDMPASTFYYYVPLDTQNLVFGNDYELIAWTSNPNGTTDDLPSNDTMTATVHVGLHGTYTVGGANPDFVTIREAVDSLQSIGICDTTMILIRPGTYNEQIVIPYIPGVFGKRIIFSAETGDSSSVIVQYDAMNSDSNYVVMFDNAFEIVWEKMTIHALGADQAVVVELRNYSTSNTVRNCAINGKVTTSTSYDYACIFSRSRNNDNTFSHNTMSNGSYGYFHEIIPPSVVIGLHENTSESRGSGSGSPEDYVERTRITGNHFLNFGKSAVRTYLTKGLQIHDNDMESSQSNVWAMHIDEDLDTLSISNNTVYLPNGQYALHLSNVDPAAGKRATIYNNMFNLPGSNASTIGAGIYNCTNLDFHHNTIRIHNASLSSFPYYQSGGAIDSVYNNIFTNTGSGPAIYTNTSFLNHYDYNNYYTLGSILGTFGSATYNAADLAAWQFFTGFDDHSISFNPLFVSATNLHARSTLINGKGSGLLSAGLDIDAEIRNPTTPDPGADEFTPDTSDCGITGVLSPLPDCVPEQDIKLVLANLGADSLLTVTIEWTVNGIPQPSVVFTPALGPEGDTTQVVLSSFIFTNQPDTLRFWTSSPNGSPDTQPENDTLSIIFRLPLQGVYTIGGDTPDFPTFTAASLAMKKYTICGPVTFKVRDGVYTEQVFIDSIVGSSPDNTITFESESLDSATVTLQYSSTSTTKNYVLQLNGTDYITFRHLSFVALNPYIADILDAINGVTHLTISNNYFDGTHLNGSSGICIKAFAFGINEYITIQDNYFKDGHYALYFINPGASLESRSRGIHIENNLMENQRYYGLRISNTQDLSIRDNIITTNSPSPFVGIDLNSSHMSTEISGNTIHYVNSGSAMFLNNLNFQTTPGITRIFNNMTRSASSGEGIRIWNSRRTFVQYNTSYASGSGNAFELVGGDSCVMQNNILVSNTGRTVSSGISTPPTATFDYNDLFTIAGNVGYWNNTLYPTLPAWQAGTGYDAHSMSIDPEFVSSSDLHVLADTLDGAATPIAGITIDLDHNPRNAVSPDIGADEIGANDDDAGVLALIPEMPFARGNQPIKAVIRNYGGNTISSVDIHWELNSIAQPVIQFTGSLPSLQQDTVVIGSVEFLLSTPYNIKSWTANPNTNTDYYNSNDTLVANALYAAVSDTVTIGGTAPDVPTIDAAVTALSLGGVLDSVHFQIRNGTYHYALTLPQTAGMNCTTPIFFESESGNATDVTWDNQGINNHTLVLDGADGITIRRLTLKTTNVSYHAVDVRNGATCNRIEGCHVEGMPTTNTGPSQATLYAYGSNNNSNTIKGNTISNGSYGLYWHGNYNTTGLTIDENTFENAYYASLAAAGCIAPLISANTITTTSTYAYLYGIQLSDCTQGSVVDANKIYLPGKRGGGILLYYSQGTAIDRGLLSNNYINLGQSSSSYGLQHHYSNYWNIFHNTVRISGGEATGAAYLRTYSTHVHLANNLFDNRAGGAALSFSGNEGPLSSDRNDLLTNGTALVHYAGTNYPDLEAWQITDFDTSSISVDPMYVTNDGYAVTSAALNAIGFPLDLVPMDIDGEVRDTITPDIGCDEFFLANDDVGILSINYPTQPFPSGENTVFIKFINNGQDTLVSMQVDWEVDSIAQPTYYWTGLLPSAGTYDSLDIGIFDFEPYQAHSIKVWVSLPNGVPDELASNDTLVSEDLYPALMGTYTIGGNNPDFDSIGQAVNALNLGGIAGDVIFQIRSGTYLETINLTDFPGSNCMNSVTFQSESGDSTDVIISNLGINDNIVTLDGADGIIFQNLTLKSVNPAFRNVINYFNGAHCNQFLHNHLEGYQGTSTSFNDAVILSANTIDTANVFGHNLVEYGSVGFYLTANGTRQNTLIHHNMITNNYESGIYAYGEAVISILNNVVTGSSNTYYNGIQLEHCHGSTRVEGNDIRCNSANHILSLDYCLALSGARGSVVNNFLSSNGSYGYVGLLINNSKRYDVFHNNISTNTNNPSTAFYYHTDSSLTITNNIIVNSGAGHIVYGNNQSSFSSDYNDFYGAGGFGTWNGAGIADLEAWQTATSQDAHSLGINPQYMSDENLHVSNILLNGAGLSLASVTSDIDGDLRDSIPDIGADEFDPSIANDAGVFMYMGPSAPFAPGSQPVTVALKNYGYDTLTSADIRWIINGAEQPVYEWTGTLGPAQCDTVVIGNYSFPEHTAHTMILWSEAPNGVPDSTHVNDTMSVYEVYPALNGIYTVGGILPDFNLFLQVESALNKGGILGNVTFNIRNGTYSTQLVITDFPRTNYAHQVTFQSESGDSTLVTIKKDFYQPATNYTIRLSDAHHIAFKDLTMASTQGRILDLADGSSQIQIHNCRFKGVDISYPSGAHQLIYSHTTTEDSVYITGNRFEEGDYGIYLTASGGDPEKEVIIENNYFYNIRYRSIHTFYHDGLMIKGNTIYNSQHEHEGIAITASTNTKEIAENDIRLLLGGSHGLYMHDVSGTSGTPTKVYNNYILIRNWGYDAHGINHAYGSYNNFYYNTVRIENTGGNSTAFIDYQSNNNIHIRNCVLSNYSGGVAMYNFWYPGYNTNTMDYCDLYTTGPVLAKYYYSYNDLGSLQIGTGQNVNSVSAEPLFPNDDPHLFQNACEGAAIPIAGITTDLEGEIRNATNPDIGCDEFTLPAHDIGAKSLLDPETYCGLGNAEVINIRIQNYGSNPETAFDVAYSINGSGWTVENVGTLNVIPGGTADYTFTATADLSQAGTYTFALRTFMGSDQNHGNDTLWNIVVEHIPALTAPVTNMIPGDDETGLENTVSISWAPTPNATHYDVYVWPDGETQPVTPQIPNLSQINTLYGNLSYGTTYNWQVVAKNICNQFSNSPIQQFSIRFLPDILIDTVIAPSTAFSGQTIELEWLVKNTGPGSTLAQLWSDAVFLSTDATLNTSFDTYIGAVQNLTALDTAMAYTQTGEFVIPNGMTGDFYVFVYADRWSQLLETNNNNNWDRTSTPMMITLTPSPDLVVDNVTIPGSAFSGQSIPVTFIVENNGFGATDAMLWRDLISIGTSPVSSGGGIPLSNVIHSVAVQPDSSYQVNTTVILPQNISGEYYIYIHADYLNQQYEFGAENNNTLISDTLEIFLTPPPDLTPISIVCPDTVSSNEILNVSWTVQNAGANGPTASYWYDKIDLSPSPVYNVNFNTQLTSASHAPPLAPGETYQKTKSITIPIFAHGPYYLYATADINNDVFEYTYESNNILRITNPIHVMSPDLAPINVAHPVSAMAGGTAVVTYLTVNHGPGDMINRSYRDKIYLSTDQVLNAGDIEVSSTPYYTSLLQASDTLMRSSVVTIPQTTSGTYYLLVDSDANHDVFEDGLESNNMISSPVTIQIFLPPWPDLLPQSITIDDTLTAGDLFPITYEILNQGAGDALSLGVDGIYLSPSPTWNPVLATKIVSLSNSGGLQNDSTDLNSHTLLLPATLPGNVYYLYVWADEEGTVFENGMDANNIQRSASVFINSFPAVDLVADTLYTSLDTLYSGTSFSPYYLVQNGGTGDLLSNSWLDKAFLSADSTLEYNLDLSAGTVTITTPGIAPGGTRSFQSNFSIPDGVSGDYYFFGEVDFNDLNIDTDRSNNKAMLRTAAGAARKIHVKLSPYPELRIMNFTAPGIATAGQPALFEWETENAGTGAASEWVEKIYLSADNTIGNGDFLLYAHTLSNLGSGSFMANDTSVFLPVEASGNYFLILQTDANNQLYEHNGENNNIVLRSVVITAPPPSDLVTSDIAVPASVIAGESAVITWNTSNQGAYVANGQLREIIYLSSDPVLDVEDEIFAIRDGSVFLPPLGVVASSQEETVTGVEVGDYYALVQTDARDNILESSNSNNVSASVDLMNVDVKLLYLDSLTMDTLINNRELYYKIEIPSSNEGYNLLVRLRGDTLESTNELFARYGMVPSRAEFDVAFDRPFDSYQEFIIHNIQPGTYYIMAYGLHDTASQQPVELYARLVTYSLVSVSPGKGGNDGFVTMTLKGSNLDSTSIVRLVDTLFNYHLADTFMIIDDGTIVARFDLRGVPPDIYTIQSIRPDDHLGELVDAFTVIEGGGPDLQVVYSYSPGSFFTNTPVTKLVVEGINNGDNDAENMEFKIESVFGSQLSLTYEDYLNNITTNSITVPIQPNIGFEDVLAPGQTIRYEFPMRTQPYPLASIIVIENE